MASSVNLGKVLEAYVEDLVKNGRYGSRSEVLREGIRLVQDREAKLAAFDATITKAMASADLGKGLPLDEAFDQLDAYADSLAQKDAA